jgi:hypothetical protein
MEHRAYGQVPDPHRHHPTNAAWCGLVSRSTRCPRVSRWWTGTQWAANTRTDPPTSGYKPDDRAADAVLPTSQPVWGAVLGAVSGGTVEAIVGLLGGLHAYAPTAAFAMIKLGLPASIVGAIVGLIVGSILAVGRRLSRNDH